MWFECCKLEDEIEDKRASDQLQILCQAVKKSSSIIVITDPQGNIEFVNPKFTEVTGYEGEEASGKNMSILNSGRQSQEFYERMWETIETGEEWHGEFCNRRKSGEIYWAYSSISSLTDDSGELIHYVCVQEDITQRHRLHQKLRKANRRLNQAAKIDALTELPNRRHFDEIYERELAHSQRAGNTLAILMIDIDFFKEFNDSFGHPEGDDCLKKLAGLIDTNLVRKNDFAARYGGEEFVVILPDTDLFGAKQVGERIQRSVEAAGIENPASRCSDVVTVSIGVAASRVDIHPDYDLIEEADKALYAAKESGRNKVVAISPEQK